jgi:hypothetical protein
VASSSDSTSKVSKLGPVIQCSCGSDADDTPLHLLLIRRMLLRSYRCLSPLQDKTIGSARKCI